MYRHTQIGWVTLIALGGAAVIFGVIGWMARTQGAPLMQTPLPYLVPVLLLSALLFATLTVVVDEAAVRIRFGPGLIRKTVPLREIVSCAPVKNAWWMGWGIHGIPGRGWLWNVSGFDAVELTLKDGPYLRIGTDEPEALQAALRERIARAP